MNGTLHHRILRGLLTMLAALLAADAVAQAEPRPALDCVVLPDLVVEVGSAASGVIEQVLVDRADRVARGQPLATLEAGVQRAEVALARTRAALDAEVQLHEVSLAYERRRLDRTRNLQQKLAVSAHERDRVDTEARLAAWRLRQARDRRDLAGLELTRAEALLRQRTVTSPIDGVVVERYKAAGEHVDEEPLLRLARLDPLRVEVIVPMAMFSEIAPGMIAEVRPQAPAGVTRRAAVTVSRPPRRLSRPRRGSGAAAADRGR